MEENRDGGGGYAVRSGCGEVVERLWSGDGAVVDRLWSGHNYSHYYCQLTTVIVLVYLCFDLR